MLLNRHSCVSILLLVAASVHAAELPPDLAAVPANAAGFAHIRIGEIYRSDHFKDARAMLAKAGPDAIKKLSERFVPDPTTLERVTAFAILPKSEGPPKPIPSIVFHMSKPFDKAKLEKSLAPQGAPMRAGDKAFMVDQQNDMAVYVIDDRTFQISPAFAMEKLLANRAAAGGPLAPVLAKAASRPLTMAFNSAAIPAELRAQIPAPAVPIAKLDLATLTVEFGTNVKVDLRFVYPDAESAGDAEQMMHTLIEMGRSGLVGARAELDRMLEGVGRPSSVMELPEASAALVGLGALRQYEDILKALPLKRDGNAISLALEITPEMHSNIVATSAIGIGLLLPAVQKVRMAAGGAQGANNLKQLALAMHNYNDVYAGKLPAHAIYSKDCKTPLLSWRVAILPYIEQDNLYREFHLDEPWDSEHNKKLIPMMPKLFTPPNAPPTKEPGMTYYQLFVGGGAAWEKSSKQPGIPRSFPDGTSNTIMMAEAGDPVIRTKPDDMEYDPKKPLPRLGKAWNPAGFLAAMADGSVRTVGPKVTEKTLRAAITAAGNETLGPDWDQ